MNNQKQKIRTINAKALFKYFPKGKDDKIYAIYLVNKALCRHVIKQEEDMEECPVFHQFYKEIESRCSEDEKFEITSTTLLNKMLVMDFDNIFMFFDESASDSVKGYRESLQESAKDIIENGFDIYAEESDTPVHMVAFDKSGNMSRKSRISFIDENYYDALNERLNLGMDFSGIEIQESKYYAYRGLYLSSSKRIEHEDFDITPETLVIIQDERKDPKNPDKSITGYNYEKTTYISAKENLNNVGNNGKVWDIDDQGEKKVLYVDKPFDGVGFIAPSYGKLVNAALGTEGATSFQIRLPFVKGMLHQVDVHGFLDEYNINRSEDSHIYIDAFGIKRDLGKARIFITESMFKAKKWILEYLKNTGEEDMDPMVFYCEMLKKYDHALYVSGTNLPYGHSKYVHLSYQTINTLNFSKEQFERILDRHKSFIKNPIEYLNSFDLEAGDDGDSVDSEEGRIDYRIPNWRRALIANEQLSDDIYIKHELKNTQKGLLTKLATGKILVEGQTRYLCRDLLPLLVSLIENPPNFYPKYLYFRFYLPTDGNDANADELGLGFNSYYAFFRNPHLSRNEQYIMRRFCDTDEATYKGRYAYKYYMYSRAIYDKYFGSLTGIVMVPRHSVLPLCLGGADFDGDLVSIVYNQDVVAAVASGVFVKAKTKLFGEVQMRNLPVIEIPSTLSEKTSIKEHVPYEHIKNTFSNRIGQISDAAISIGQMEYGHVLIEDSQSKTEAREQSVENESKEEKYSKPSCTMCTILTGLEIDAAKNGEHPNLDSILSNDIEKCSYIKFLHKFKKLRGEANYSFNNLKVESRENGGKKYIEVTAKNCSTVAKFYPPVFGTFINELPLAFYDAFTYYAKDGKAEEEKDEKKGSKGKKAEKNQAEIVFAYANNKKDEELKIEEFKSKCQNVFDYHFFYSKTMMYILSSEKNKGFYAIENLEKKLYQAYDEEEAVRIQRIVVPRLIAHLKSYINDNNTVEGIKDRINEKKWLFVPMEKRETVLEEIIAGGFSVDMLDDEEKEVLFNFRNRGYINLWLVLSIIEGPKTYTFDEVLSCNIKCNIMVRDKKLEEKLTEYLRAYYNHNASDALGKIYATCLKSLGSIIKNSGLSEQNMIAALYEMTDSSMDNRKFFWDLISWERLEKGLMENIKSYAYDNGKIENGWEGWNKEYTEFLKEKVFCENKKRYSYGRVYCDPDEGNIEYYTQICHFLNSQEQKIIEENKWYHYCTGIYNEKARINVCKNGKFIFCLKSDQFGFSAPTYKNKNTHPYGVYYNGADDKAKAIANIVKWVYITRTIGGSFLWPEEEKYPQPPYNNDRGGSQHPKRSSYINDRVDLTLLEIKHFYDIKEKLKEQLKEPEYDDFIDEYKKKKPIDVLCNSLGKSPNLYEWLMHFDSFDTYIKYFKFDMFTSKDGGVIDITSTEGNCLKEVDDRKGIKKYFWKKKFDKVFDILCSKIKERTREIDKSIK